MTYNDKVTCTLGVLPHQPRFKQSNGHFFKLFWINLAQLTQGSVPEYSVINYSYMTTLSPTRDQPSNSYGRGSFDYFLKTRQGLPP